METSDVISMFPTLVWKIQLQADLRDALAARILAALEGARRGLPPLGAGQGWQSERTLHQREELQGLVACIDRAARGILR